MRHLLPRLLLALMTFTIAAQPIAASAQDTIARAQAAQALTTARKAAPYATDWHDRVEKLRRAAALGAATDPSRLDVATGVTLTQAASADAGLTKVYDINNGLLSRVRMTGGREKHESITAAFMPVASIAPATNGNLAGVLPSTPSYQAWAWEAAFDTDADRIQILMTGYSSPDKAFRILVDGRYITKTPTPHANNNANNFITIDFAGVRAMRSIRLEAASFTGFRSIRVGPASTIALPRASADQVIVLGTGDSYTESIGATSVIDGWLKQSGRAMGWTDARQVAVGSTGYVNNGSTRSKLADQVPMWPIVNSDLADASGKMPSVDVVTVAAGYNDYFAVAGTTYTPAQIAAEAINAWRAIRAMCPNAWIMVFGAHAGARGPDQRTVDIENALAAAFASWGDPHASFAPIATDPTPWTTGNGAQVIFTGDLVGATSGTLATAFAGGTRTYNLVFSDGSVRAATLTSGSTAVTWTGAVTATAVAAAYIDARGTSEWAISPDYIHPSTGGHGLYARRATAAMRSALAAPAIGLQ